MLSYEVKVKTLFDPEETSARQRSSLLRLYETMEIKPPRNVQSLLDKKTLKTSELSMMINNKFMGIPDGESIESQHLETTAADFVESLSNTVAKVYGKPLKELPKIKVIDEKESSTQADVKYNLKDNSIHIWSKPHKYRIIDHWTKPSLMNGIVNELSSVFVLKHRANRKTTKSSFEELWPTLLETTDQLMLNYQYILGSLSSVLGYNAFKALPTSPDVLKCISNYEWNRAVFSSRNGWTAAYGYGAERTIPTFENLINKGVRPYQLNSIDLGYYKPNTASFKIIDSNSSMELEEGLKTAKIPFRKI